MKLKPEDLSAHGYYLADSLNHKELIPFVQTYIKKLTWFSVGYWICNLLLMGIIGFYFIYCKGHEGFTPGKGLSYLSYGFVLAFVLLPLHEYLHVLAYKSQGAEKTSYDANFRKFYFLAIADRFVANRKEFLIVALAPVVTISSFLMLLLPFSGQLWTLTILGSLLVHTSMCSGDFALLSYFEFHGDKEIVTYDDRETGMSFFYAKKK